MEYEHSDPREAEARHMDAQRQQRKIVRVLETGDLNVLGEHDAEINDQERADIQARLRDGRLSHQVHSMLRGIESPFSRADIDRVALYDGIQAHEELAAKLDDVLYGDDPSVRLRGHASEQMFSRFLEKYPTPDLYQESVEQIIRNHEAEIQANPRSSRASALGVDISFRRQQLAAAQPLLHRIYGKRADYWDRVQELRDDTST